MRRIGAYESGKRISLPGGVMSPGGISLTGELIGLSGLKKGARILDVGCGLGYAAAYLRGLGFEAAGVDIAQELIAAGHELHPGTPLFVSDSACLPFADGELDAALFECSLSEMPIASALGECRRILKSGGVLLMSDLYSPHGPECGESAPPTLEDWRRKLSDNGFTVTLMKDRSRALSDFIAQLLWSGVKLDAFSGFGKRGKAARPGYFIAAASKP